MMKRMWMRITGVAVLGMLWAVAGCEDLPDSETPIANTPEAAAAQSANDQAEWDAIHWISGNGAGQPGAAKVMQLSASINGSGSQVSFSWDHYPWGDAGIVDFFVWNGSAWEGGKFDWIREGGQSVKGLENVHGHYNGLRVPASGTPVAFAWTSANGSQRSNLSKTVWP